MKNTIGQQSHAPEYNGHQNHEVGQGEEFDEEGGRVEAGLELPHPHDDLLPTMPNEDTGRYPAFANSPMKGTNKPSSCRR